jgi:transcriptional regulator with XRE-family HTH domain
MSEPDAVDTEIARLAQRVRRWREEAGYTLQELADRSDVATSTIQKVESYQMVPSVAVMLKIARGLGRSASELVSEAPAERSVVHLEASERHPVGNRRRMVVERISGDLAEAAVEMWRITVQPGYGSGRDAIAFSGEELVLCEQGELNVRIGDDEYRLRAGDVLHFKAQAPHSWRNEGRSAARFLILGTLSPALRVALHRRISGRAGKGAKA